MLLFSFFKCIWNQVSVFKIYNYCIICCCVLICLVLKFLYRPLSTITSDTVNSKTPCFNLETAVWNAQSNVKLKLSAQYWKLSIDVTHYSAISVYAVYIETIFLLCNCTAILWISSGPDAAQSSIETTRTYTLSRKTAKLASTHIDNNKTIIDTIVYYYRLKYGIQYIPKLEFILSCSSFKRK